MLLERQELKFPNKAGKFDFDREVVVFFGQDGKIRVRCDISREALDNDFGADNRDKVEVFRESGSSSKEEPGRPGCTTF